MTKLTGAFVLNATAADVATLRATAAALEDEVMAFYEDFLFYDDRCVDEHRWKPLRTDDHVRIFKERRKGVTAGAGSPISPTTLCELEPQASLASQSSIRRVLAVGVIPGNLDDALLGCSFHDTPSLRACEAYMGSRRDDCAVVLTIDGSTVNEPFRFLGLTRHLHNPVLSKARDYLLLQHTHVINIRSRERVVVRLRHSIEHQDSGQLFGFPGAPVLVSSVTFYRQLDEHTLEVFGAELVDKKRHTPDAIQRHGLAQDLLLNRTVCDMGLKKKLLWLLENQHLSRHVAILEATKVNPKHCDMCRKSTRGLLSASGSFCQLCATVGTLLLQLYGILTAMLTIPLCAATQHICTNCTMTHRLVLDSSGANVATKTFGFCVKCILLAKQVSSGRVALEDVRHCWAANDRVLLEPPSVDPLTAPFDLSFQSILLDKQMS